MYTTIWLLLDSIYHLVCGSFTKDHNVSETGSVYILRWMGQDGPVIETGSFWQAQLSRSILPHPSEDRDRSSLQNVVVFCKTSTYQTMDRVQKKPNSSVQHTPSSESFQVYPSRRNYDGLFFSLVDCTESYRLLYCRLYARLSDVDT
jgi:hypothetical protein